MQEEEKRMYPHPKTSEYPDFASDDGDFIVVDPGWTSNLAFVNGVNGLRIQKDYLSRTLRCRFLDMDNDPQNDRIDNYLRRLVKEIVEKFDKEIQCFEALWHGQNSFPTDFFFVDYVAYVLKSELDFEYDRILDLIWSRTEEDDEVYYDRLKHDVEFPGETEEEKARKERYKSFLQKSDDSDNEDLNNANDAE